MRSTVLETFDSVDLGRRRSQRGGGPDGGILGYVGLGRGRKDWRRGHGAGGWVKEKEGYKAGWAQERKF